MQASLIDTIFLSEKRKNLLLLLMNGPKDIDQIKEVLDVTASAMLPQIKKLRKLDLIEYDDKVYSLTEAARMLVTKMEPLLGTIEVLEDNYEYWMSRHLSDIPEEFRNRIWNLKKCELKKPDMIYIFEPPKEFNESLAKSASIETLASFFHPQCPHNYAMLAKRGINITLILTKPVFDRMKQDSEKDLRTILESDRSELFILKEDVPIGSISVTDNLFMITLFNKEMVLDHLKLTSYDPESLQWGSELIEHFKKLSIPVEKEKMLQEITK
ncbi:winged helix-turn-helix domain-containing protein [Methanococcoides orientis]|uniref:helix-turn-helix transcriptional regulator n=1 Tax=Methanococcoides orientis TaxID=2822137 RepID=UPI001E4647DB|nr:winged helix-turn-helix domain-containing protein [Methanococcoides orientis]UGV41079.1 winged helix-turn-helix domain-containing protein [Methanococcoides orientis]